MKEWVKANYPGTKIGVTEYNWGAEKSISGALAQADILGIFGREGVDLATRWTCPGTKLPRSKPFQMFRNFDGKNSTFGDTSISCTGGNPDEVSAFASQNGTTGSVFVMLINKRPSEAAQVKVALEHASGTTASLYRLTSANKIAKLADAAVSGSSISMILPAESITLVEVK